MASVLAALREILFPCSHWIRTLRSLLTTLFIFLTESLIFNSQVSSTKWKIFEFFIVMLRFLIKIKKSKGPRTDPWGTWYSTVLKWELRPLIDTNWVLSLDRTWTNHLRYLLYHNDLVFQAVYHGLQCLMFFRGIKVLHANFLSSSAFCMLSSKVKIAWFVEKCFLNILYL